MGVLILLLPLAIYGLGIFFIIWTISTLNTLVQENRKIRKLLEHKFSLNEEEKLSLYEDINPNTWKTVFQSKSTLILVAIVLVITVRLLLKIYHIW